MIGMILVMVLLLICFFDIQKNESMILFGQESTVALKGIASILILFHHIEINIGGLFLNRMNFPTVAIFFLVAGYSTMHGYINKFQYEKQILKRKIPVLLFWSLLSVILTCIFYWIIGDAVSIDELKKCLLGNKILNWFFPSLIIKYLIFIVCSCLFSKQRNFLFGLFFFICLYMIVCRVVGLGGSWYCSSLAFPFGALMNVLFANKQRVGVEIKKYNRGGGGIICAALFCLSFAGVYVETNNLFSRLLHLAFQILSSLFFSIFLALTFMNKKSRGLCEWCGKNSAQMIFAQSISLVVFRSSIVYIKNDLLFVVLSIMVTALYIVLLSPVYDYIALRIGKGRNRK